MRARPDDFVRMGIEGHYHDWQAKLGACLPGVSDVALVPAVHTVEDADGYDRGAPVIGDLGRALPSLHPHYPLTSLPQPGVITGRPGRS